MVQVKILGEALPQPRTLRIKFKKLGNLQYISHLDLVRTFNKMLIRVGMPLWYSEGFNPKPKMVFAFSMSIGLQSECEFLDVKITNDVDFESVKEALNLTSTEELSVSEVYYPETKFTEIKFASYIIEIESENISKTVSEKCENILKSKPLIVNKYTKSGEKDVDISPYVYDVTVCQSENGNLKIELMISSDNGSFLNPEYFITALKKEIEILGADLLKNRYSIVRKCVYDENKKIFS